MKVLHVLTVLMLSLFIGDVALAQYADLRVSTVRAPWKSGYGRLEEAVMSVRPQGIYMEYGIYLTIGPNENQGISYTASDTLEVTFTFDLPEEAIVHDAWLWVENDIIQADILDRWTASSIYENIVRRQRRDPLIVFKESNTRYSLNIYPLPALETRKIKLTYLVPADWTPRRVSAPLPTHLFQPRRAQLPDTLRILARDIDEWKRPRLVQYPDQAFVEETDPRLGRYAHFEFKQQGEFPQLTFAVDSPTRNGVYLSHFPEGDGGWYQMAMFPAGTVQAGLARKVLLVLDYDELHTHEDKESLLEAARAVFHTSVVPPDSFNVVYSRLGVQQFEDQWLPATSDTIEETLTTINAGAFDDASNLPDLLTQAVRFIEQNGEEGVVLLVSSSATYGEYNVANELIRNLRRVQDPLPPIYVADFAAPFRIRNEVGGRTYYNNDYLYTNLGKISGGNHVSRMSYNSVLEMLDQLVPALGGPISALNVHTTLQDGFAFGQMSSTDGELTTRQQAPIYQVGRYSGTMPFVVEMSGIFAGNTFSNQVQFPLSAFTESDLTLKKLWAGKHIYGLEQGPQTNDVVTQIVDFSIEQRVLSRYTAFLALEPSLGGVICNACVDESDLVTTSTESEPEVVSSEVRVEAFPNPFRERVTIRIVLPEPINAYDASFEIYDAMGRLVKRLDPPSTGLLQSFELEWDGTDEGGRAVASGTYFFIMKTPHGQKTLTLVRIR